MECAQRTGIPSDAPGLLRLPLHGRHDPLWRARLGAQRDRGDGHLRHQGTRREPRSLLCHQAGVNSKSGPRPLNFTKILRI